MASFKGYDREDGQKRRQGQRKARRNGIPKIEFLERRQLLTGGTNVIPSPVWAPSDPSNLLDAQNGPMANLGAGTVGIYAAYVYSGGNTSQLAAEFPTIQFQNGMVDLQVKTTIGLMRNVWIQDKIPLSSCQFGRSPPRCPHNPSNNPSIHTLFFFFVS